MKKPAELAFLAVLCAELVGACGNRPTEPAASATAVASKPEPGAAKPADPGWKPFVPPAADGVMKCEFDPSQPGPMQRGGRARIRISGPGVAIDVTDVPALCGPLFNTDVVALAVKAGEGLLFEACLPEGVLRISSDGRTSGKQQVHAGQFPRGTDVLFNKHRGSTYSTRGVATDGIVLSADFWGVEADVVLQELDADHELRAKISFECAPKPASEK